MKNSLFRSGDSKLARPVCSRSGVALVVVLSVLVLLTILVVGFLTLASGERTSAGAYFESNRNRFLADTVVNMAQAQIDHASTHLENGQPVAWASQPGMVRTFNADGSLLRAYKLYSDDKMVDTSVDLSASVSALTNWWKSPSVYVDLNEPVLTTQGTGQKKAVYPIIDNAALQSYTLEDNGFGVSDAPVNAADADPDLGIRQQIPMPVKWLYLLEDGTAVAPTATGAQVAITGATRANPIVGRVAFWTDDEGSKLNINTAAHGFYWDTPRVSSFEDRDRMARFQPARHEFQRYPGHPATTSLKPAFRPDLFSSTTDFANFVYGLAPRIAQGGSLGGTVAPTAPVDLDSDRLYSSVDELLFAQDRHPQLNASDLEMAKFFLTARSNSPEVNLFNQPRMAIWPINAGTKKPSTLDKLIAFCATINKQPYYFQRQSPSSSTADMTSFNGRNRDLWNYINQELAQPIPGFGHTTFADKYTAPETKQITTEIFDYIRSTNLYSTALGADAYTGDVNPSSTSGSLTPPRKPGTRVGQTTPLKIDDTKGFGRIPTISRAIFQLFISGARRVDASGNPIAGAQWTPTAIGRTPYLDPTDASNAVYTGWQNFLNTVKAGEKVQLLTSGILYFDTFDPNVGYTAPRYNFLVNVTSSGAWQVNRQSLNFPANATVKVNLDQNYLYNSKTNQTLNLFLSRFLGGPLGPQWMMQNYSFLQGNPVNAFSHKITYDVGTIDYGQLLQTSPKNTGYPLVSARIPIHVPITLIGSTPKNLPNNSVIPAAERTPNIQFSGGSLTVQLEAGGAGGNTGEVVQTYHFDFPPFQKPAPIYADNETRSPRSATMVFPTAKQFPVSADFRFRWNNAPWWHAFYSPGAYVSNPQDDDDRQYDYVDLRLVQDGDVAVSLVPVNGDKRLLAAKSDLDTATDFQPHQDYTNPAVRAAVDFRTDNLGAHSNYKLTPGSGNGRPGRILNLSYGANGMPDIPGHMPNGVQTALGLPFVPDFDNAPFYVPDDAYINRADAGSVTDQLGTATGVNASGGSGGREVAWYVDRPDQSAWASGKDNENFFSPARQMPSAVMFGSLPTGVKRNKPWQTLLFRPDPGKHPGASNPPDYALLDLFWMPVVEPYAISEPFSSNGKVNMNYQIAPFTYITRANALHGVMLSEEMLAVPDSQVNAGSGPSAYNPNIFSDGVEATGAASYKAYSADLTNLFSTYQFRKKINVTETLKGFQQRFDAGQIFRSETEICSLSLIPEGETWKANFESWWDNYRLTGDNSREQPYAHLLPRLTTKSNTYTVHFRVQSLKKHPVTSDAEAALWDEARDAVTSEYRGSRTVERYIDPNDERIPNYAQTPGTTPSLAQFYRWRTLANREFSP